MTEEEKKLITREKHPERIAQRHKFSALMKKRKDEILRKKEHSTYSLQNSLHCSL